MDNVDEFSEDEGSNRIIDENEQEESQADKGELLDNLIVEVKARSILYNVTCNGNRNNFLKQKAWDEVSALVKMEATWCKSEWNKLKDNYRKKKITIKGKTGQARKKIEAWPYFFSLGFLDDFNVANPCTSGNFTETFADQSDSNKPEDITYSKKRHRKKELDPVDAEIITYLKKPKEVEDEHHHFAMGIAEELRKMSPQMASYIKMKISGFIYESLYPQPPNA